MSIAGAALFARFAIAPNVLGYCGPPEHEALRAIAGGDLVDADAARQIAQGFEGAWPYLELLAGAAGCADPLDERIVEAYWLGNELLARVQHTEWGWHLHDRFAGRNRSGARAVLETVGDGGLANHAFHVFEVYPWMGMLREGRGGDEPLRIMDRCRIRPGVVTAVSSGLVRVLCRPLEWDGVRLMLGAARPEEAILSTVEVTVGDVVALHWDWVCQVLAPRQAGWLDRVTMQQLALVERHHTLLRTGY
ncbi:MAG: hypothetical protein KDB21_08280 [Acidimicrobiales bacterium]|nr:hypothetical protein [Acidimicrobiales bacterium]